MESCGGQARITANCCHLFPSFLIHLLSKHQHIPSNFVRKKNVQQNNAQMTVKQLNPLFDFRSDGKVTQERSHLFREWCERVAIELMAARTSLTGGDLLSPEKPISQPVPHDLEEGHNLNFTMIYESLQRDQKHWDCVMWNLMLLTIS